MWTLRYLAVIRWPGGPARPVGRTAAMAHGRKRRGLPTALHGAETRRDARGGRAAATVWRQHPWRARPGAGANAMRTHAGRGPLPYPSATAAGLLAAARAAYARSGLADRCIIQSGADTLLIPWAGSQATATLAAQLTAARASTPLTTV
jgi:hypothetical protein